jgi:hypothetical protein
MSRNSYIKIFKEIFIEFFIEVFLEIYLEIYIENFSQKKNLITVKLGLYEL